MKSTSAIDLSQTSHEPHEYVRVVPLHHPKPYVALENLGKKSEGADTELFDGQPHPAPANARLTYRGGHLLTSVKVHTVFWGSKWSAGPGAAMLTKLNDFFTTILHSELMT